MLAALSIGCHAHGPEGGLPNIGSRHSPTHEKGDQSPSAWVHDLTVSEEVAGS